MSHERMRSATTDSDGGRVRYAASSSVTARIASCGDLFFSAAEPIDIDGAVEAVAEAPVCYCCGVGIGAELSQVSRTCVMGGGSRNIFGARVERVVVGACIDVASCRIGVDLLGVRVIEFNIAVTSPMSRVTADEDA
jgi:hypothetical protein